MTPIDAIRKKIYNLYTTNPNIHINVSTSTPKSILNNLPVTIKGVYPHIFQIEDKSSGTAKCYTHQYSDLLTRRLEIIELTK